MLEMTGAGATAIRENMTEKQRLMATLGARLLEEQPGTAETATAVGMRHAGSHATLKLIAQVAEQGLTAALQWHAWWMGTEEKPQDTGALVELNKEFMPQMMTPEQLKSWVFALQAEAVSYQTFFEALKRGGVARPGIAAEEELREIARNQ